MSARPHRVHVVCSEIPPDVVGGLGRYAERVTAALEHSGVPVEVYGTAGPRSRSPRTERAGDVTLHRVRTVGAGRAGDSRTPLPVRQLARIAGLVAFNVRVAVRVLRAEARRPRAERGGTVVAVHDWMGCLAGILCRLIGRLPVVFHVHTRELNAAPSPRRSPVAAAVSALETLQARTARLIVVPSDGMRDDLAARGWPRDRLRVVPHGFEDPDLLRLAALPDADRDRLRAQVRRRHLPGGEGRLVVFAGRLSPHKGVRTLIRAASRVAREHDDVRIVLLGAQAPRTDDDAETARLIEQEGVGRHVAAGYRFVDAPEVFAHFLAADVCVFPSVYEPFGLVAVEAMALGRPVVVGPGYSPEVVGDGALRYAHDSPEELAEALSRCLDDRETAARLAARGAAHVRDRFTWARTAELTLTAYGEAAR
ncbi:glycosyltransferase family 4 protein [Planomonospora sp. ID82291]|uniref:glycosyltransferase family 4 protein n=1 Tax=Planomonospora sp. ID82291 TaxID=2738136 RepID=UPI0018C41B33|nr:glycosyltransferase family 4 protein [Planomonospora sp. ID82291]MBG0818870.1 glycosyltransferase family 4 protein [Planomonospora sp. ID82291]